MLAILWAGLGPALAEDPQPLKGVALVIGQSAYRQLPKLENPAHDATAVSGLLTSLGFEVTAIADRNAKRLRRDLENFASDAEGANVAVVYYSGHGIEAGGEDWLVPVDADPAHLEALENSLVPLSGLIDELRASVPLTILFLDACRSNPFPKGTSSGWRMARRCRWPRRGSLPRAASSLPLRPSRRIWAGDCVRRRARPGGARWAARRQQPLYRRASQAPGSHGWSGVRHRHADGDREVYLKTEARQRPWVNESLAQLVYLGKREALPAGEPGAILNERRRLLLSIAKLPDLDRLQVEQAAQTAGVPMDALYGLLRALGTETPSDPETLGRVLKAQAERVKALLAQQESLASSDPEIARLTDLRATR